MAQRSHAADPKSVEEIEAKLFRSRLKRSTQMPFPDQRGPIADRLK